MRRKYQTHYSIFSADEFINNRFPRRGAKHLADEQEVNTLKKNLLYNLIFPTYLLMFFPPVIFFVLAGNFLIDALVYLLISLIFYKRIRLKLYFKTVLMIWGIGFSGDIIGAFICFIPELFYLRVDKFPFIILGFLMAILAIFLMNYRLFRAEIYSLSKNKRAAAIIAVSTAPVTFFLPRQYLLDLANKAMTLFS